MKNYLKNINDLLPNIIEKDLKHAIKCINQRDFESLIDLINYSIKYYTKLKLEDDNIKNRLENLKTLKVEVEEYYNIIEEKYLDEEEF